LEIADEGVGIPDEEKGRIFEKFYRVGNENTRSTKGTGLGLYLTERILRQHQGRIAVRTNNPKGSIFEIRLPTV
jgi:signal transduction histidine kinase